MSRGRVLCAALLAAALLAGGAMAAEFRFPMPEFDSGYTRPPMKLPPAALTSPVVDVALLAGLMALTAWAVIWRRSRAWTLSIACFSLFYFGFYRLGCVCSVGSLQNVANAFFGNGAAVPLVVSAFFVLPLVFALWFGRVFCAAVCPLGALQEVCAVRPVQLPRPVEQALGLLAHAYLGLAVVGVVTGSGFLVCQYDPFVGFFRRGASFNMLLAGGILLALGIFVARPYCRFLCPYGVLLRWVSIFSRWHASVTPAGCIQCRLCESACPVNAIEFPTPSAPPEPRAAGLRRTRRLLLAAPLIVLFAAGAGWTAHPWLSRLHPTVRLAERMAAEEAGRITETTIDTDTFRAGQQSLAGLYAAAGEVNHRYKYAGAGFGAFMGLVVCGRLLRLTTLRQRPDYEVDRGACVSCARCFAYCPVEKSNAEV